MLRNGYRAARRGLVAVLAWGLAGAAAANPAGTAQHWQFDFYDTASGGSVAYGDLAYDGVARGVLGFDDLSRFHIVVLGIGYDLADMATLTDYAWLGWDSDAGNFLRRDSLCGSSGCIGALISARSAAGTRGFHIDDAAMTVREHSTGRTGGYDLFGLGQAMALPEPASWAMLIAGFGLTGAAMRRRAATRMLPIG